MNCQKNERPMKKHWILCLVLIVLAFTRVGFSKDVVRLYFFYSEEGGGQKVNDQFIRPLSKKYPLEVKSFSLNKLNNYDILARFEKELKQEDNELPVVIIGNSILAQLPHCGERNALFMGVLIFFSHYVPSHAKFSLAL